MDANYFREKAALCLRLADGLALNNPGRFQLMDFSRGFPKARQRTRNRICTARDAIECHSDAVL
jgi:hypothetical protein